MYDTKPTLLISHHDEPLDWMHKCDFSKFNVKIHGQDGKYINIKDLKCTIDNYDKLPLITVFLPDSVTKSYARKYKLWCTNKYGMQTLYALYNQRML